MGLNVIGISANYHDAACCLLRDGQLVAAAQEERFTRVKNDPAIPAQAFRYCLAQAGLSIADIHCLAYYENPRKKASRQIWMSMLPELSEQRRTRLLDRLGRPSPLDELRGVLGYEGEIEVMDHHRAHAASAYYFSGFADAAIMTVDGVGEWATTTYGQGAGAAIDSFEEVHFPHSLGLLYSAVTAYLGFEVNEGEYKVMGLAPYGQPRHLARLEKLIVSQANGQFALDMRYFDFLRHDRMFSDELVELLGRPPRIPESDLESFHEDVARSLQVLLENILLEKTAYLGSQVDSENLCMAGGVALNCVANARLLEEGPFARLFVQPAAGDAGGAIGAAAVAHVRREGKLPGARRLNHVYLGPRYEGDRIRKLLRASAAQFEDYAGREAELISATAARLAAGEIVGWFQGRLEFGPRALCARSILADPRDPQMRDRINALVKQREAFRPFAPVVLASKAQEHFDIDHDSPFMLETCVVHSRLQLPAITHVDRSARIQTLDPATNPRMAALLTEFERRTGCPILLNTSFNVRGEPIVNRPEDALLCFVKAQLDSLVIEDLIVDKKRVPEFWTLSAMYLPSTGSGVDRNVYTML